MPESAVSAAVLAGWRAKLAAADRNAAMASPEPLEWQVTVDALLPRIGFPPDEMVHPDYKKFKPKE